MIQLNILFIAMLFIGQFNAGSESLEDPVDSQHCFNANEIISFGGLLVNGLKEGEWKGFDQHGSLSFSEMYVADKLVNGRRFNNKDTTIYKKIYNPAYSEEVNWLAQHIITPEAGMINGKEATLNAKVIISETGALLDVEVLNELDASVEDCVIETIRNRTSWQPAIYRGKAVLSCQLLKVELERQ
ncbi:hypothetical protein QQ020_30750 [Fulvivirgaceae bacterium BMA12]|uniref:TonB C-terminal domain-containing protein n=1 Tax=Agaribacillus aureus TaxID=3051825 RepID=A0ABT8LFZ4_9BACT|nr:hypothetical protein [Fulvivirgaceae bacterium BMA12]